MTAVRLSLTDCLSLRHWLDGGRSKYPAWRSHDAAGCAESRTAAAPAALWLTDNGDGPARGWIIDQHTEAT